MAAKPRVAVVGAGITGLLVAHGLKKNGIDAVIYERDESIDARARDWTILVHWALPLLNELLPQDIVPNLSDAVCNPNLEFGEEVECLPVYNGATDALLFKSPTPGARRVCRQRLRKLLVNGLDIKWGHRVKNIDTLSNDHTARLEFEGAADAVEVGFVVGADGAASKVRELLLGTEKAKPVGCGFMFATGTARYRDREKVKAIVDKHPVAAVSMGTRAVGSVGAEDPDRMEHWETFWVKIWKGGPVFMQGAEALTFMKQNLEGLSGVFKDAIEWTPEGSPCWINEMRYWYAEPWDNRGGREAAFDDTEAALTFLVSTKVRGQGMQHAVMDAVNYVETLTKVLDTGEGASDRSKLLSDMETEMIERGNQAVKQSLEEAEKALDAEMVSKMLMATKGHVKS